MSKPRPRILAIDDTPTNLLTLGAALEADFDLQIATSGAMGLAMATKAPPDLILLDVMMPEMDGYETCRRIMASPALRTIPVIFITALARIETESAGLTLGAADYITKPINVEITRQRIRNCSNGNNCGRKWNCTVITSKNSCRLVRWPCRSPRKRPKQPTGPRVASWPT
jgi:PleD family two-component response regulator